jgi:probable addiction module antidote protein
MKKEKHGIDLKDCVLSKEDSTSFYARVISKNPKEVKAYKKYVIEQYNKTKELDVFLENLKILAKAENVAALAKKTEMKRNNIYRFLSKDNNPTLKNFLPLINEIGITFEACEAK